MRIVFVTRTLPHGGAERQLTGLARGLADAGHAVSIAVFYAGGPLEQELSAAGIPVIDLRKGGRWDTLGFLFRAARILRSQNADVYHGYLPVPNILCAILKPIHRGKVVWGIRASRMDLASYGWISKVDGALERVTARVPDLIISNSHAGKNDVIARGYPRSRTIVIPNGIDLERFRFDPTGRSRVRAEIAVPDDAVLIGRIGRIDPQKDYPTFLRAAACIAEHDQRARFVIVGDGQQELRTTLTDLVHDLGIADRIAWLSGRSDMAAIYSACDITISSSAFGEGTPNAVAESLACGTPCVTTDIGDSARAVGDSAWVCPPNDPSALSDAALHAIARLDAGAIDRSALRAHVAHHFAFDQLISRTEAVLHTITTTAQGRGNRHTTHEMESITA